MRTVGTIRLLAFARELQRATSFAELLEITRAEIESSLGYRHAWLFVADSEDGRELRMIDIAGSKREEGWQVTPLLRVEGDAMLEAIMKGDEPVVVEDARTDPRTNKEIVERLQNRTIVNVPMRLLDKPFGALGTGTFGDEGTRPPTPAQLDHLVGMAGQLAVAAGRIRFLEERRRAEAELLERERTITRQAQAIRELSTPVLQIRRGVLIAPLVGTVDADRAHQLTETLLAKIRSVRARCAIIDITGVPTVDTEVAHLLVETAAACRLMGASILISGISAEVAQTVASFDGLLTSIETVADLEAAVARCTEIEARRDV